MLTSIFSRNLLKSKKDEKYDEPLAKRLKFSSVDCPLLELFLDEAWTANKKEKWKALELMQTVGNIMEQDVNIRKDLKNILHFLIKCHDNINYTNEDGQTILHLYLINNESCYIKRHKEDSIVAKSMVFRIVKSLLDRGASVNMADKYGRTPLHIAAMIKNKMELIVPMLKYFSNINACDNVGNTVLHTVVRFDASLSINGNLLIQFPCEVYHNRNINEHLFFGIVCILLSRGADPNKRNYFGMTPLQYSIRICKVMLLRIFREHNADFNVYTDNGDNLLNLVVQQDHCTLSCAIDESKIIETINYLVIQGCDVNDQNRDGFSIMHLIAKRNPAANVIMRLVKLGAEVNCKTKEKRQTPLHLAIINYAHAFTSKHKNLTFRKIIRALTCGGADWYAMDYQGRTPLHYALRDDNRPMWSWFLRFAVNINDQNVKNIVRECHIKVSSKLMKVALELKTIGFAIDREYELTIANPTVLRKHREKCLKEVEKMRILIIGRSRVSLYQFLHISWQRQFALIRYLPENLEQEFPIYHATIWKVCSKAILRRRWFEPAKMAFQRIIQMNLPDSCLSRIVTLLGNWNMKSLIDASKTHF